MKIVQVMALTLLTVFLTVSIVYATEKPHSYLLEEDVGKMQNMQELYRAILSLQGEHTFRRTEFFSELKENLGLSKSQVSALKDDPSRVNIVVWSQNMQPLIAAGLLDKKSTYWRFVNPGEKVVLFKINDTWKPAFLLRCANLVRAVVSVKQTTRGERYVSDKRVGCWKTGKPQVQTHRPYYIASNRNGEKEVAYQEKEYTYVFPTRCVTDDDYRKLEQQ